MLIHYLKINSIFTEEIKGLSVVSEETLKRINKEIPINSKYLKQGIAVMGTLSAKYHQTFEDNVYLEFCDKLFTTSLNNIKDRKTAKKDN